VKDAPDPGTCDGAQVCGSDRKCGKPAHEACTSDAECAEGPCRTYYLDEDRDGYGTAPMSRCDVEPAPPAGYVTTGGDCCDADADVHPGQVQYFWTKSACGSFDYNCDGVEEPETACNLGCGVACVHSALMPVPPTSCR
jgi:hypothetical protein